jgi:phosphoribosylformylglycinamidine cyclo-ligase
MKMTYAKAGVDIEKKSDAIESLLKTLGYTRKGVGKRIKVSDSYAGFIEFGSYALGLCTDGVGTKLMVANALSKWDTIGIDCVAMNVNDMICHGAEPLGFVDYIAMQEPDEYISSQIGIGLEEGLKMANCSMVGGELAIVPELVNGFDLAGTCFGWVKKSALITGRKCAPGDVIIGIESSGVHSNGLTLARKILEANEIPYTEKFSGLSRSIGLELLEPTKIYVRKILRLLKICDVHGLAHITGGGLRNIIRLNPGVEFRIEKPLQPQPIFGVLAEMGNVDDKEMFQTFNMGMGMAVVVPEKQASKALTALNLGKTKARIVGKVYAGSGVLCTEVGVEYTRY